MDDFGSILGSPLMKGIPTALVIGLLAWVLTEALTSWMPEKYRPAIAVLLGVGMGYITARAGLVDFGAGPDGWLRAIIFGAIGGAGAPIAHPLLKNIPGLSWLAGITPSGRKATAAAAAPPAGGVE